MLIPRRVSTLSTRVSRQIRLADDVYEHLKTNKRDNESFSDAIERLIRDYRLRNPHGVFDEEQASEMRDAIGAVDQVDRDEVHEMAAFQERLFERAEDVEQSLEDVTRTGFGDTSKDAN